MFDRLPLDYLRLNGRSVGSADESAANKVDIVNFAVDTPRADQRTITPAAARPAGRIVLGLIRAEHDFRTLESEWNALFAAAGRPHQLFQSFGWLRHWAKHYLGNGSELAIVTGRCEGRLVMVWPLVLTRIAGLRYLTWMGQPVSQYGDVLVQAGDGAHELLRKGWTAVTSLSADVLDLRRIRADAAVAPILAEVGAVQTGSAAAPYIDLGRSADFAEYLQSRSAKARASQRRRLRRLSALGTLSCAQYARGEAARKLVIQAIELKREWLTSRGHFSSAVQDPRFSAFFADISLARMHPLDLRVSALHLNGRAVALDISLECMRHVFGHVLAYDAVYARYAVGSLMVEYTIQMAHQTKCTRFDLLPPAEPYKFEWTDTATAVHDWAFPLSRAGRFYLQVWLCSGRHKVKRMLAGMPPAYVWMLSHGLHIYHRARAAAEGASGAAPAGFRKRLQVAARRLRGFLS